MTGKTIKQLFKALNDTNNMIEVLNENDKMSLRIYIDEEKIYEGTKYNEFNKILKKEYIKEFAEIINNIVFCGCNVKDIYYYKGKHTIELYVC